MCQKRLGKDLLSSLYCWTSSSPLGVDPSLTLFFMALSLKDSSSSAECKWIRAVRWWEKKKVVTKTACAHQHGDFHKHCSFICFGKTWRKFHITDSSALTVTNQNRGTLSCACVSMCASLGSITSTVSWIMCILSPHGYILLRPTTTVHINLSTSLRHCFHFFCPCSVCRSLTLSQTMTHG